MASVGSWRSRGALLRLFSLPIPHIYPFNSLNIRRGIHESVYDKNVEQEVVPPVVQKNVVEPDSDKYWAPHPETGVFGPDTNVDPTTSQTPSNGNCEDSVLEQQAFFRPQEDLEIPEEEFDKPIEP